jgi:hypothetical protein
MALTTIISNDIQLFCPVFYCVFSLSFFLVFGCFVVADSKRYSPMLLSPFVFMNLGVFLILFFICLIYLVLKSFMFFLGIV